MWIDYAVRQVLHTAGTFARQPGLLLATKTHASSFPSAAEVSAGDTVISLTTYGKRLSTAVYSIASLLVGTVRLPVILWLDEEDFNAPWPPGLKRLVQRGLDVRCSDGKYGPHTKYYGTFQAFAGKGVRVITVDDDMMYPRWFVEKLLNAADASPRNVVAYRAHTIALRKDAIAPYKEWTATFTTEPSFRHFATGVSGVIYPASMVDYVAAQGKGFQGTSPLADDVWLHHCALRSGHRVRQVFPHPREFSIIPMSQRQALVRRNQWGSGNDMQIAATYTDEDIAVLIAEPTDED